MTLLSMHLQRRVAWGTWQLPPRVFGDELACRAFLGDVALPELCQLWMARYNELPPPTVTAELRVLPMTECGRPGQLRPALPGEHHAEVHLHLTITGDYHVRA